MLSPGARLGPYEVEAALGAGGMGEVYRARDTRLDRIVAVKILSEALGSDPQFRERFDREARAISQLTHPHICVLHDIGRDQGVDYIVMEYLEGETLADRLAGGTRRSSSGSKAASSAGSGITPGGIARPVALNDALTIAIQVADALDKAHRAGIVHRDLKPGNIMLTKSGAKLLDFGLAKTGASAVAGAGMTMMPTTPATLTAQGTILGTFQYMAPEQLEGKEADARSDIFAFGCVLYEMITGMKAFEGKSHASLIASILDHEPPPVSTVRPVAPAFLDHIIARCLAKNPERRWATAHDLLHDLRWVAEHPDAATAAKGMPATVGVRQWNAAGVALIVVVAAVASATWIFKPPPASAPPLITRFAVVLPQDQTISRVGRHVVALSPDGGRLVYVANAQLHLRSMDQVEAVPIRGTEGIDPAEPVFSPDGQW